MRLGTKLKFPEKNQVLLPFFSKSENLNMENISNVRMFVQTFEYYSFVSKLTYKLLILNCKELHKEYYSLKNYFQNI